MEAPIPPPTDTQEDFQFPSLAIPTSSPALSGSSSPTPLPTSSAASDPLTSIAETMEKTLIPLQQPAANSVPHFVLTDPAASSEIEKAMTDSVMTVTAPGMRRDVSAESSRPLKASTSGADLILPIIIFAVVKSNPPQLASQLMFLRRYRSAICLTGEASYAIVNLTAVVEFLEHVNLAELGLGDESDKVIR